MSPKLLTLALLLAAANVSAEPWTYSGTLSDGDKPANGRYDLRVTLLDASRSNPIGSPITFYSVDVRDGAFTVDVDFGSDLSNAPPMRLKTEVSKNNAPFVALGEPTRFDPKVALAGVCWDTQGNAGTNPATNFIGTTDTQPLVLRVKNAQVLRLSPATLSPNFLAGDPGNIINTTKSGQVIAGGGTQMTTCGVADRNCRNATSNDYATVSGGVSNISSGFSSFIGGGNENDSTASSSVVGGGFRNSASGAYSTLGGGFTNFAAGDYSVVTGGGANWAFGEYSAADGGYTNTASGLMSVASGGKYNCAGGDFSWVGGQNGTVRNGNAVSAGTCPYAGNSGDSDGDNGTFLWAGSGASQFSSTGPNQFLILAHGGVAINTATKPNFIPIDAELTITSNFARPDTNVEIFMYPRASTYGYLMGVQGTQQSNDTFFITQTDGNSFTNALMIDGNGNTFVKGGVVSNLSDVRLKKNIGPIARPLDQLLALQGHVYEYIDPAKAMNEPGQRMGFVAQEVQTVLPNWVKPTGSEGYLAVTPIGFEALTVEAMRDLKAEGDVRMEALEKENASLRARLEALEAKVKP